MGKSSINEGCSVAMFDYQRVWHQCLVTFLGSTVTFFVSPAVQPCQSIIFIMAISCLKRSMFFILPSRVTAWGPTNNTSHRIVSWDETKGVISQKKNTSSGANHLDTLCCFLMFFVYLWDST